MATSNLGFQNKFTTTLSAGISASDTTISLTTLPTPTEGYLILEPDSSTSWEEIYYTSKTGSAVVCPNVGTGRGVGGSTAASHSSGATVRMDSSAEMFIALQNGTGLATNAITADKLATSALTLGYAQITSTSNTGSNTPNAGTGTLGVLVTIPAGGRQVRVTVYTNSLNNSSSQPNLFLYSGASVGTLTTQLQAWFGITSSLGPGAALTWVGTPSAGSVAYTMAISNSGSGTTNFSASSTAPGFILVEAI